MEVHAAGGQRHEGDAALEACHLIRARDVQRRAYDKRLKRGAKSRLDSLGVFRARFDQIRHGADDALVALARVACIQHRADRIAETLARGVHLIERDPA